MYTHAAYKLANAPVQFKTWNGSIHKAQRFEFELDLLKKGDITRCGYLSSEDLNPSSDLSQYESITCKFAYKYNSKPPMTIPMIKVFIALCPVSLGVGLDTMVALTEDGKLLPITERLSKFQRYCKSGWEDKNEFNESGKGAASLQKEFLSPLFSMRTAQEGRELKFTVPSIVTFEQKKPMISYMFKAEKLPALTINFETPSWEIGSAVPEPIDDIMSTSLDIV